MYSSALCCRYNMMNHHFFEEKDINVFDSFIGEGPGKTVAIVIDPPFGIMVEALSATIEKIQQAQKSLQQGNLIIIATTPL